MTPTPASPPVVVEHEVLTAFWKRVGDGGDRLELLRELVDTTVTTAHGWSPDATRAAAIETPYPLTGCFTCYRRDRALNWHHIVPVARGGSNSPWNRVAICHVCHRRLHPWLKEEKDDGGWSGFVGVQDILQKLVTPGAFTVPPPRQQVRDDEGHDRPGSDDEE